jgi:hypothetical protein
MFMRNMSSEIVSQRKEEMHLKVWLRRGNSVLTFDTSRLKVYIIKLQHPTRPCAGL